MTSQGKRNITADPRIRASGISRVSRKASPRKTPVTEGGYRRPNRGLVASLPQGAAKNCDGGLGQIKPGSSVCVHCGFHRRPVGVGEASLCIGMPLVLGASKCRGDRPEENRSAFAFASWNAMRTCGHATGPGSPPAATTGRQAAARHRRSPASGRPGLPDPLPRETSDARRLQAVPIPD
jgi:hypothetical protein